MSKSKRAAVLLVVVALVFSRPGTAQVGRFPGADVLTSFWERMSSYVLPDEGREAWDPNGIATAGRGAGETIGLKGRGGWDPDGAASPPPSCDPADQSCDH